MDIKQHCSCSIGIICRMNFSLSKIPDKPCINCSKCKFSIFCFFSCSVNIIQYPCNLCRTEIRIRNKPCLFFDNICHIIIMHYFFNRISCSSALPHNRIVYRFSSLFIPYNCRFSLICNSYCFNIICRNINHCHSFNGNTKL